MVAKFADGEAMTGSKSSGIAAALSLRIAAVRFVPSTGTISTSNRMGAGRGIPFVRSGVIWPE